MPSGTAAATPQARCREDGVELVREHEHRRLDVGQLGHVVLSDPGCAGRVLPVLPARAEAIGQAARQRQSQLDHRRVTSLRGGEERLQHHEPLDALGETGSRRVQLDQPGHQQAPRGAELAAADHERGRADELGAAQGHRLRDERPQRGAQDVRGSDRLQDRQRIIGHVADGPRRRRAGGAGHAPVVERDHLVAGVRQCPRRAQRGPHGGRLPCPADEQNDASVTDAVDVEGDVDPFAVTVPILVSLRRINRPRDPTPCVLPPPVGVVPPPSPRVGSRWSDLRRRSKPDPGAGHEQEEHMRTKRLIVKAAAIGCLLALGVAAAPSASAHGGGSSKVRVLAEGLSSPKGLATTGTGDPVVAQGAFGPPGPVLVFPQSGRDKGAAIPVTDPVNLTDVAISPTDGTGWGIGPGEPPITPTCTTSSPTARSRRCSTSPPTRSPTPTRWIRRASPRNPTRSASRSTNWATTDRGRRRQRPDQGHAERRATTVARFDLEAVETDHLPPEFGVFPPEITAEAVPTTVTIGPDGAIYVGELKGFPFRPGTSNVWRIDPRHGVLVLGQHPEPRVQRVPGRVHGHPGHRLQAGERKL